MIFTIFMELYNHYHNEILEHVCHPDGYHYIQFTDENPYPFSSHSLSCPLSF